MNIETLLITVGALGILGSLVALGMGYLVHLNEERDKQWWEARNVDFSEPVQTNASYRVEKTTGSELRSACADAEVTSGGTSAVGRKQKPGGS